MITDKFHRNLAALRRDSGLSQKKVSADLGISQALLSHYEKGIREPSFDFLIRCADYFDCSVDYLLGRTNDKRGIAYIPEEYDLDRGDEYPADEIRRINDSVTTLFSILSSTENDPILAQSIGYIKLSLYRLIRQICAGTENRPSCFKLDIQASNSLSSAMLSILEDKIHGIKPNVYSELPAAAATQENINGWKALTAIINETEEQAELLSRFDFTQD